MDADQTYNSIAFKKAGDDLARRIGERRANARGVSTPDVMTVKNQEYIDPSNKVAGKRYTAGFDYYETDANGVIVKSTIYLVVAVPSTSSSTAMTSQLATFRAFVAASGMIEKVVNGEL